MDKRENLIGNAGRGFTLIEVAVVLAILGVLFFLITPSVVGRIAAARLEATKEKEELIKSALIAFVARNNRLPCPAIETLPPTNANYGREAATPGTCTGATALTAGAVRGIIPWLALGLNDDFAMDGYYNRYAYVVTTTQTNLVANTVPGMAGNLPIHNMTPIAVANQINVNNLAVVVLISYGTNGAGAFTQTGAQIPVPVGADELENTDTANIAFIQRDISVAAGNPFDDVVMAITPADVLSGLEKSGIKSATGSINDKLAAIRSSILSFVVADVVDPDGVGAPRTRAHRLPAADSDANGTSNANVLAGTVPYTTLGLTVLQATDPWGTLIRYTAGAARLIFSPLCNTATCSDVGIFSGTPTGTAFTITSFGPNRVAGGGDDITLTMSVTETRGVLVANSQGAD